MPLRLSQFDETHILTVLGSYRLGRGWEFGARYRLTSGYMYTPETYGFYDENIGTYLAQEAYPPFGSRLPLFQSLDLRVDKTWKFRLGSIERLPRRAQRLQQRQRRRASATTTTSRRRRSSAICPFLPSLGIRGGVLTMKRRASAPRRGWFRGCGAWARRRARPRLPERDGDRHACASSPRGPASRGPNRATR